MERMVAVDHHSKTNFVVIHAAAGEEVLRRRFPTDRAGEEKLVAQLRPGDVVVLEATAGSHRLANRLEGSGAVVRVIDPQHARLVGMRGKKTDYRDCLALLELLRSNSLVDVWRPDPETRETRQLTRERQGYNQSIVRLKNRIHALMHEEGLSGASDLWSEQGQQWLSEQTLRPVSQRILGRELVALKQLEELKQLQEQEFLERTQGSEDAQRLTQIMGFGAVAAQMIMGEIGRWDRFGVEKQVVSYAGLNPRTNQSGPHRHNGPITKAGRRDLRTIMIEVAWSHVAANGPEAAFYHRLVGRGKEKGVAIVALARKLLVLAYRLCRRQEPYRGVNLEKYEAKLARLGARRPHTDEAQENSREWAAQRVEAATGMTAPYHIQHPDGGRKRRQPAARARVLSVEAATLALIGGTQAAGSPRPGPVASPEPRGTTLKGRLPQLQEPLRNAEVRLGSDAGGAAS